LYEVKHHKKTLHLVETVLSDFHYCVVSNMNGEKFCLRWNDFETNISVAFRELREDKDFFDVTLACDDEQIQAHKMILSACSPFFKNILRRNPHQHPLLYLKGVKYSDLQSVLNFMYHGEVNVAQEELNSFLSVAEDLRVKGLTQNQAEPSNARPANPQNFRSIPSSKISQQQPHSKEPMPPKRPWPVESSLPASTSSPAIFSSPGQGMDDDIQEVVPVKTEPREHPLPSTPTVLPPVQDTDRHSLAPVEDGDYGYQDDQYAEYDQYQAEGDVGVGQADYAPTQELAGQTFQDPSELQQFVRKDLEDNKFFCTICERFSHRSAAMARNHVESQHFPNTFSYPCDLCGDVMSSKSSFMLHRSRKHLNKKQK